MSNMLTCLRLPLDHLHPSNHSLLDFFDAYMHEFPNATITHGSSPTIAALAIHKSD